LLLFFGKSVPLLLSKLLGLPFDDRLEEHVLTLLMISGVGFLREHSHVIKLLI